MIYETSGMEQIRAEIEGERPQRVNTHSKGDAEFDANAEFIIRTYATIPSLPLRAAALRSFVPHLQHELQSSRSLAFTGCTTGSVGLKKDAMILLPRVHLKHRVIREKKKHLQRNACRGSTNSTPFESGRSITGQLCPPWLLPSH